MKCELGCQERLGHTGRFRGTAESEQLSHTYTRVQIHDNHPQPCFHGKQLQPETNPVGVNTPDCKRASV